MDIIEPDNVDNKFTILLSMNENPLINLFCCSWWIDNSVNLLHLSQKYCAWIVAPIILSINVPNIAPKIDIINIFVLNENPFTEDDRIIIIIPKIDANDPNTVIPPYIPVSTSLKLVINRGFFELNKPISVANVSPVAIAIDVINPIKNNSLFVK